MLRRVGPVLLTLPLFASCGESDTTNPDTEPELRYAHAGGIRLNQLLVNQAVEVEVVAGNEVRAGESYSVKLLADRPMMVRATFSAHHEFEPRELLGQLTIRYPEGELDDEGEPLDELVLDSLVEVTGDSDPTRLTGTFAWYVERQYVRPGMRLRVDAYEPEPLAEGESEPDPDPEAPPAERIDAPALPWAQSDVALEIATDPMRMKVVLVPIEHQLGDCVAKAEVDDADVVAMQRDLEENNPVQSTEFSVREPMIYTDPIGEQDKGFSPILSQLAQLRDADGAAPNVYYYGLVATCDGYPGGLAGQAFGIPSAPDPEQAYQHVAAGRWVGEGSAAAETFVHELGHLIGRYHVRCSGSEAGVDQGYPHPGGVTGVWGFGIYDSTLHSPAGSRDYMTYCANEWVSDYGYNHAWEFIQAYTALEGAAVELGDEILVGTVYADGTSEFWTTRGKVTGERDGAHFVTWDVQGELVVVEAGVADQPDGDAWVVTAALPEGVGAQARFALSGGVIEEYGVVEGELDLLRRTPR